MTFDAGRLMDLWNAAPPADDAEAAVAFSALYTDPVLINGAPVTVAQVVAVARALHRTYADQERVVVDVADAGDKVAVAFVLRGRHAGPVDTPTGRLEATGRTVEQRAIDILTLRGGRIAEVTVVSDDLGALRTLGWPPGA